MDGDQLEFGEPVPHPPGAPTPEPAPEPAPEPEVDVEALQRQLQEAQQRENEANQRYEQTQSLLTQVIGNPQGAAPEPEPLGPAPNPIEDPEGYTDWGERRLAQTEERIRREVGAQTAAAQEAMTRDRLWVEFQQEYPEYAGMDDLAQIAFIQVSGGQLPADHGKLKRDVKAKMDEFRVRFLPGESAEAAGGDDPPTPPLEEPNRTGDLGEPSVPQPPPTQKPEKAKSMVDTISELQEKSGFY